MEQANELILNKIKFLCEQNRRSLKDLIQSIEVTEAGFYGFFRNDTLKLRDLRKISTELGVEMSYWFTGAGIETVLPNHNIGTKELRSIRDELLQAIREVRTPKQ